MVKFLTAEELIDPLVNVTGRCAKGIVNENIKALDPIRINQIKNVVLSYMSGDINEKLSTWLKCKNAMTKKLSTLKKQFQKKI